MELHIRCNNVELARCSVCGSMLNLLKDYTKAYCGHCGAQMELEVTEKAIKGALEEENKVEDGEIFTQMSLF